MSVSRQEAIGLIEAASRPTDLFTGDAAAAYRRLARLTHPDTGPPDPAAAGDTVSTALATLGADRGVRTVATLPADLDGPSGNGRL